MSDNKVDMFDLLKHVDKGDLDYWENLSEDEKKSVAFVVVSRWMSCTKNPDQIVAVNHLLNPLVFNFGTKHKGLLYRLMLIASSGTEKRYQWIGKKKKVPSKPTATQVVSEYYNLKLERANSYLDMLTLDDVLECAEGLGYDDASVKKIKNEYKP